MAVRSCPVNWMALSHTTTAQRSQLPTSGNLNTTGFDYGNKSVSAFDYGTKTTNSGGEHAHAVDVYYLNTSQQAAKVGAGGQWAGGLEPGQHTQVGRMLILLVLVRTTTLLVSERMPTLSTLVRTAAA